MDGAHASEEVVDSHPPCDSKNGDNVIYPPPEIEVKVLNNSMLLKVHCKNHQGILPRIIAEIEECDLSVINGSIMAFGTTAFDITIVARMGITSDDEKVRGLIRTLHSILQVP